MKFLVDDSIQSEGRELNFIDVGIHDNVELTEIKVDVSPKGSNFIAFTFTSEDGKKLTKTEWEPLGDDEAKMKKGKNQAKRIKHIMARFVSAEQTVIEYDFDNWTKFASTVKAKLDPFIKGVKLRIKAVYDDKNYVSLPNYLDFIERMDVDKTKLSISSIDKMTREEADKEVPVTNLLENLSTTTNSVTYKERTDNSDITQIANALAAENTGDGLPF